MDKRHWSGRWRERNDWMEQVLEAIQHAGPDARHELRRLSGGATPENAYAAEQMRVEIHVVQPACLFDEDNLQASVKPLLDAISRQGLGLIWDDSPRWLQKPPVTQEIVSPANGGKPGTRVRIGKA